MSALAELIAAAGFEDHTPIPVALATVDDTGRLEQAMSGVRRNGLRVVTLTAGADMQKVIALTDAALEHAYSSASSSVR